MKLTDEESKAIELCQSNFNSLPYDLRKGLPDLFTRWQEVEKLIGQQEHILSKLNERRNYLRKELVKWYHDYNKGD